MIVIIVTATKTPTVHCTIMFGFEIHQKLKFTVVGCMASIVLYDSNNLPLGYIHVTERECKLSSTIPNEIIHLIILFTYFGGTDLNTIQSVEHIKLNTNIIETNITYKYSRQHHLLVFNPYHHLGYIDNEPHPYSVAAGAFSRMIERKINQTIIISGHSGSGKVMLHYKEFNNLQY